MRRIISCVPFLPEAMGSGIATHRRAVTETLLSGILLFFAAEGFTSEAVFVIGHGR